MINGFTTITQRIVVAALFIATSAHLHAGAHGKMAKRHQMSCWQLFKTAFVGLAVAQHATATSTPICVQMTGKIEDDLHFSTKFNNPVCHQPGLNVDQATGAMIVVLRNSKAQVTSLTTVDCPTTSRINVNGMQEVSSQCLPLYALDNVHVTYSTVSKQKPLALPQN